MHIFLKVKNFVKKHVDTLIDSGNEILILSKLKDKKYIQYT